jgi:hypothetical protein
MTLEALEYGDTYQAHASLTPEEVAATIPKLEQIVDQRTERSSSYGRVEGESLLGVLQSFDYAEKSKPLELENIDAEEIARIVITGMANILCRTNYSLSDDEQSRAA